MEILGLEKLSLVDYEGYICATIFTGGCNFRCPFCHNSGLVNQEVDPINEIEVLDYLRKRIGLLDAVTISGGEPTLQKDLESFIMKVKKLGYKVKLDTNGTMPDVLEHLLSKQLLDYVAMDIKNCFEMYSPITGVKNSCVEKIQSSLKILAESGINYELRTTLVNEFHNQECIQQMANDLAGHPLLYLQKFIDSGACIVGGLTHINKEKAIMYQKILQKNIKDVKLRGY